ncbi:S1C family serine protease [Planctomicrobium sp. SH527]|uniref:S1C family serine protease n=1 Tax=Planctomicrobium sp. SH527 TaxID=3448123 RepID=UPI003F5C1EA5
MRQFVVCLLAAVLGSCLSLWIMDSRLTSTGQQAAAQSDRNPYSLPAIPKPFTPTLIPANLFNAQGLTPDEVVNVAVYENCNRSVVNISTTGVRTERFFMMAIPEEGSGSGAVLDKQGHILTNFHVIERARQINVTLFNEETLTAKLVGADPVNDIAIIKIETKEDVLVPIPLGDSDHLLVGMRVFALGNPFGLERSMSQGIISSLNRTLEVQRNWVIKSIIQIDASINPGNSGGPLLNTRGQLIGMNTAIASRVEQSAGIGFAIPVNLIRRVVPELMQHGKVIRGEIGITHVTVTDQGLRVMRLAPGGPAEKAGVKGPQIARRGPIVIEDRAAADIIVGVNDQPVATAAEFLGLIESKKPGDVVELQVRRKDGVVKVPVTLGGSDSSSESDRI